MLLVLVLLGLSARPAQATVGGPSEIELLGFDDTTKTLWYEEHTNDVTRRFRMPFVSPPAFVARDAEPGWLSPLIMLPTDAVTVTGHLPCGEATGAPAAGCELAVTLRGPRLRAKTVQLHTQTLRDLEVVRLGLVPGTKLAAALVRFRGKFFEGGYTRDAIVLLSYRGPGRVAPAVRAAPKVDIEQQVRGDQSFGLSLVAVEEGERREVPFGVFSRPRCREVTDVPAELSAVPGARLLLDCGSPLVVAEHRGVVSVHRWSGVRTHPVEEVARLHLRSTAPATPGLAFVAP
ncbi:MAG: hypothetical protein R3B72_06540 [Polyangiaceae bacterium]